MGNDQKRWDQKYRQKEHGNDLLPDPLLVKFSHLFSKSQIVVDLACGTGRNTIHLAKLGCFVVALDVSQLALQQCLNFAASSKVEIFPVAADLNAYRFSAETVDAMICFNYLNRNLAANIYQALKPGGLFVMQTFNRNFLLVNPKFNPNYVLAPGDLSKMFHSLEPISKCDDCQMQASTKSYLVARKPA